MSEKDWPEPDKLDAYAKSKTLAEKAAWDFVKELKGGFLPLWFPCCQTCAGVRSGSLKLYNAFVRNLSVEPFAFQNCTMPESFNCSLMIADLGQWETCLL